MFFVCLSSFDGRKKRTGSKKDLEKQRLQHKVRRETKGAIREIKKDARFLAKQQLQETLEMSVFILPCGFVYVSDDFVILLPLFLHEPNFFFFFFFACAYVLSLMTYAVCCDVLFCSIAEEGRSPKISFLVFFYFIFLAFGLLFSNHFL
jgi:hypothetical protein